MSPTDGNEVHASSGLPVIVRRLWRHKQLIEDRFFGALNRRVDRRVTVTVGSVVLIWILGCATVLVHVRPEFYEVVAQMLPVLLLVGAVNGGYFRDLGSKDPFARFFLRGFWVGGVVAEIAALAVVARGHDSILLRGCVIYGLLLCGTIATVYAWDGPARPRPRPSAPQPVLPRSQVAVPSQRPPTKPHTTRQIPHTHALQPLSPRLSADN